MTTRKRGKATILTDTPEKNALAEEQERAKKNRFKQIDSNKTKAVKRKVLQESESSSSDDECFCLICCEAFSEKPVY
ncbi:hypothetical protein NQ318_010778 [Aromia moschata]|uniref:Uncharacterized protein n=1 Tax=Aromia moschata TaxID=1265417 RepID=A0AAV8Z0A1_9CUCU|nr:hypothetical protein NQ318_010778 [Aromia moschata]